MVARGAVVSLHLLMAFFLQQGYFLSVRVAAAARRMLRILSLPARKMLSKSPKFRFWVLSAVIPWWHVHAYRPKQSLSANMPETTAPGSSV